VSIAALVLAAPAALGATLARPLPAPEFSGIGQWHNSPPLALAQLRGKVVLVDFCTHSCLNCHHTLPFVKAWHDKYQAQGLVVVGVHTPEYPEERDSAGVAAAIRKFGVRFPVAQDKGYATWNAYHNRYWPAIYLIDKQGRIVYQHFGEGRYEETEAAIRALPAQTG
jgi:thiol-disulfide isomerase/thioredoxin